MGDLLSFSILGLVEGLTEFLPVSSSGHLIITRSLLTLTTGNDLAVDAVLQLATILALVVYFWRDIWVLADTAYRWVFRKSTDPKEIKLLVAIIVGTIPALILGLFLEHTMETLFRSTELVAYALIAGSVVMLAAEYVRPRIERSLASITWAQGLIVGFFQSLALVPGMSRSGMTIAGGMFAGFTRAEAARFGFILSLPILAGSGLKKLLDLYSAHALSTIGVDLVLGSVVAFITGLVAIHALMAFVRRTPLTVFVVYRVLLALALLVFVA